MIKKKPSGPICSDCGVKPSVSRYVTVNPPVFKNDFCGECFQIWARQVLAVHRAFR